MKFTDDEPRILKNVNVVNPKQGPVGLNNHSKFGFNIRQYYLDWQTNEFKPGKNGIMIEPESALTLVEELVGFINDTGLHQGKRVTLIIGPDLPEDADNGR